MLNGLHFTDNNLFHNIALADLVDYVKPFIYFAKASMVAIEMAGVVAAVANKKL